MSEKIQKFQIQNCIDWNIRARDVAAYNAINSTDRLKADEARRNARRHQHNIDALNLQLRGSHE